ncbi:MAG: DNA-directed RNA polymerase subunit alpha C-terminal domain-containing protein [Anaerolineae bacterium]
MADIPGINSALVTDIRSRLEAIGLALANELGKEPHDGATQALAGESDCQLETQSQAQRGNGNPSEIMMADCEIDQRVTALEALRLSPRAYNALKQKGVHTVEILRSLYPQDLGIIRNLGPKTLASIGECLDAFERATALPRIDSSLRRSSMVLEESTNSQVGSASNIQMAERLCQIRARGVALLPLSALELNDRAYHALVRHGVQSVQELSMMSVDQVFAVRSIGVKALEHIRQRLACLGLELFSTDPGSPATGTPQEGTSHTLIPHHRMTDPDRTMIGSPVLAPELSECQGSIMHLALDERTCRTLLAANLPRICNLASLSERDLLHITRRNTAIYLRILLSLQQMTELARQGLVLTDYPIAAAFTEDNTDIKALGLPSQARDALCRAGLRTVGQLASTRISVLFELLQGDRKVVEECQRVLGSAATSTHEVVGEAKSVASAPEHAPLVTTGQILDYWRGKTSGRDQQIVCLYLGIGCDCLTLQEIGDAVGVTRERVRQIVKRRVEKLHTGLTGLALRAQATAVCQLLHSMGGIMTAEDIEHHLPSAVPLGGLRPADAAVLLAAASDALAWWPRERLLFLTKLGRDKLTALWVDIETECAGTVGRVDADDLVYRVASSWMFRDDSVTEACVRACLRAHPRLVVLDDAVVGRDSETDTPDALTETAEALKRIGQPAHYTAVARMLGEIRGDSDGISEHTVHQRLMRGSGQFVRVGPGTYGLPEWPIPDNCHVETHSADDAQPRRMCELIEALRRIGGPAHYSTIAAMVADMRAGSPAPSERTIHQYLMTNRESFVRHGRGIYGLPEWDLQF